MINITVAAYPDRNVRFTYSTLSANLELAKAHSV